MPISRTYSGGSIVYFQKDLGDEIYVLQKGRVIMTTTALDTGEDVKSDVLKGEFFGVKSSLGRYPREETAQALGTTILLVFTQSEFETLVLKNTRLIMKMLRVFSKQLRDIHRQLREVMKTGAAREPSFELMGVAESFFRLGNIDHAIHAFTKYNEYYPGGVYNERCNELLGMARKGMTYPLGYAPLESVAADPHEESLEDHPEFITQSAESSLEDPFALNTSQPASDVAGGGAEKTISDLFYQGMDSFSKENFDEALRIYKECLGWNKLKNQEEADVYSKAHYEKARVEIKLEHYEDATASLSYYLKKFPTGEHVKESIYNLGIIAEKKGNLDRARSLFNRVATMPPPDKITADARKRLEKMG